MRGDEGDLERVLDHAPAMVLARVPGAEEALLVSSASIVGGFRALVIDLATADAVEILRPLEAQLRNRQAPPEPVRYADVFDAFA